VHVTTVPQLSATLPHLFVQVVVVELRVHPQTLGVVAPHAWPVAVPQIALPQLMLLPVQTSVTVPQLLPLGQVVVRHPH